MAVAGSHRLSPISWSCLAHVSRDLFRGHNSYPLAGGHLRPDADRLTDECPGNTQTCVMALMLLFVTPGELHRKLSTK